MTATMDYSCWKVPKNETAFLLWRATDSLWNRNVVSLLSSVMTVVRLPISYTSSMACRLRDPAVSMAAGNIVNVCIIRYYHTRFSWVHTTYHAIICSVCWFYFRRCLFQSHWQTVSYITIGLTAQCFIQERQVMCGLSWQRAVRPSAHGATSLPGVSASGVCHQ